MISNFILAVQYTPSTIDWNPSVAIIMIICNLFCIAIGRYAIQNSGKGPSLPVPKPEVWDNFGLPELLATTSLGHILGAGIILGLGNAGVL
ncbi:photosystem I reaction center subunit PsaK [Waterburya agarophytonicola K14]|uniref:Photosystem I reaction center subunit PsaK n=1 Tax=Waterburya agarophytonicola KI4 TaxID=2874699 RepID=A0A964BTV5_9CYAN|nr:photosystem I reaction center subunit PsaK [Waterburya agarophytonicola]MCC0178761.1 photosystem I reaction center subunit PsaK [Waterburya agarophytonicola KI4]